MTKKDVDVLAPFRTEYTDFYKPALARGDLEFHEPSLTRQEFAEEADINNIMARYESTGIHTHVNGAAPMYIDLTGLPDLRESMDIMREASTAFYGLPAKVRREFDNDPHAFYDFARDPENVEKMREWGLAEAVKAPEPPIRVEMVNPPEPQKGDDKPA